VDVVVVVVFRRRICIVTMRLVKTNPNTDARFWDNIT
ncbi:MAG: hypothetical protein ACI90V_007918, partial [Bacillariaceae sp.]